jgi:hypothetical protein
MPADRENEQPVKEPAKSRGETERQHEKALEDSFPASDPPATSNPSSSVGWEEPVKEKGKA